MQIIYILRIFNIYFKDISFINIFIIVFYELFIKFWYFFFCLKPFTGNIWNVVHPYKLFASKYTRYDDSLFLSWLVIYLLLTFAYLCIAWHIPPLIPFLTIINILFVNNSNFTPVFFKQACQTNPGADKKWVGPSS